MYSIIKALHLVGLAMFLGSLLASAAITLIASDLQEMALVAHQRRLIQVLTWALTVPGMWLTGISGLLLSLLRGGGGLYIPRWLRLKQLLFLAILLNCTFLLAPLVDHLATVSADGLLAGALPSTYASIQGRETLLGIVNIALLLGALGLAVVNAPARAE